MKGPHVFAGNPLDRGDRERRDDLWLAARATDPNSRFLPLWRLNVLLEGESSARLGWMRRADLEDRAAVKLEPIFLGLRDGVGHYAVDLSATSGEARDFGLDGAWRFEEARAAATVLSGPETGILAQARAQIDWHGRHGFCSVCGHRSEPHRGGQMRKCPACGAEHFPRTDPVVIVVVSDGDRCLLGQSRGRLSRTGMYSALAGFVDQGESVEEAVRREVREEAGIEVGGVRYHSSQPWPFPSSLMIGCHADARTVEIRRDEQEMMDVKWFGRADVLPALEGKNPNLLVPGPIAIAHHLIEAWAKGEP